MTRSEAITELYALFDAPHNADINLTRLNRLLDELTEFPPAQRTWVGLTDEKADELVQRFARYELLRAIETELRSKNEDRS